MNRRVVYSGGAPALIGGRTVTHGPSAGYVPLLRADGMTATYEHIFRTQPWVYTVAMKMVWAAARLPLHSFQMDADGTRARERSSSLAAVLKSPGPCSPFGLKQRVWRSLLIHGNALTIKERPTAGAPPSRLRPVNWPQVQTVETVDGYPVAYAVWDGASWEPYAPAEVIHHAMPGGLSPLEPLTRTLALEDAAQTFQTSSMRNGVSPRGAWITDEKLDDKTIPRLREALNEQYAGPENAGRPGLFDQGLKWNTIGTSVADTQLIDQRKLSREEVCAVFDINPTQVGILDRGTFNNTAEGRRALYVDALGPRLSLVEDEWNAQLVGGEPAWDGLFVEHETSEVLRPDPEARARVHLMNQQAGVNTVNERRRAENLPPVDAPAADMPLIPANMLPAPAVRMEPNPDPTTTPTGGTPAQGLTDAVVATAITGKEPA